MKTAEVRKKYLDFMQSKGHVIVPSSGLVPENDPTTLFTGSGMQPMIQYLLGTKHPQGTRIADSQKCFRADDIEEIGDNRHTTFFEMLGNWSFGDYFKTEQIEWMWEFLITELKLDPERLYITCFGGDDAAGVPKDVDAPKVWQELFSSIGIEASIADVGSEQAGGERGMKSGERIFHYDSAKNWWSRAGVPANMPVGEPGGPDSEMFYEFTSVEHDTAFGEYCHPNCDCGRFIEIGNNVFMQYKKMEDGSFKELEHKNIDFGGGLERLTAATNDNPDVFTIDIFADKIKQLEKLSGKKYLFKKGDLGYDEVPQCWIDDVRSMRIIADHLRAAETMIGEGIVPSNTEQGYFTRRLIRRSIIHADKLGVPAGSLSENPIIQAEETQFRKTLEKGLKKLEKSLPILREYQDGEPIPGHKMISGKILFEMFTTYGFPVELSIEEFDKMRLRNGLDKLSGVRLSRALDDFGALMQKHKEESRAGAEQKFKGGLADTSEKTTAFHTATHLMLAGLRKELGDGVTQRGSNITSERARFDFTHHEKVERDILDKVEEYVNTAIQSGAEVVIEEMDKEEAKESGAVGAFWEKYPDVVTVYNIKDPSTGSGQAATVYSRELCGGPHVESTTDISKFGTFKIKKESSSSAGVRRIKAVFVGE